MTSIFQFFETCLWAPVKFCTHCPDSALSLNCCCLGFRSLGALVKQFFETLRLSSKRSCLGLCLCLLTLVIVIVFVQTVVVLGSILWALS